VKEDLDSIVAGIVDGGPTGVGVESTVIDCTDAVPTILRPGGVSQEEIERVIGEVKLDKALISNESAPKAPGMKYTHYAPNAPLFLVNAPKERIQELVAEERRNGRKAGVLTTEENKDFYSADYIFACGKRADLSTVAANLYDGLRSFNHSDVDIIFSEMFSYEGLGHAVMNRLLKAASHQVID
jgi:L-threonylcarbamoyladenylate synthase